MAEVRVEMRDVACVEQAIGQRRGLEELLHVHLAGPKAAPGAERLDRGQRRRAQHSQRPAPEGAPQGRGECAGMPRKPSPQRDRGHRAGRRKELRPRLDLVDDGVANGLVGSLDDVDAQGDSEPLEPVNLARDEQLGQARESLEHVRDRSSAARPARRSGIGLLEDAPKPLGAGLKGKVPLDARSSRPPQSLSQIGVRERPDSAGQRGRVARAHQPSGPLMLDRRGDCADPRRHDRARRRHRFEDDVGQSIAIAAAIQNGRNDDDVRRRVFVRKVGVGPAAAERDVLCEAEAGRSSAEAARLRAPRR